VRIYKIAEDGAPWFRFRVKRKDGAWDHHSLGIYPGDDNWVMVKPRGARRRKKTETVSLPVVLRDLVIRRGAVEWNGSGWVDSPRRDAMNANWSPTTKQIKEVYEREVREAGGRVSDVYDDGARLFLRSVLPGVQEVRPGDGLQGGVALRAADPDILVQPYVFRQVCKNGAIIAQALEARSFERKEKDWDAGVPELLVEVGEAVRSCCGPEAFAAAMKPIRWSVNIEADALLQLPELARLPDGLVALIFDVYMKGRDRSGYALMNAVTSVARDTRDPELRWRLEEFGGGIAAQLEPEPKPDDAAAVLTA
jgi:hypothetical protein